MDGYWIGIIAAVIAILSIFFRRNTHNEGTRKTNRFFLLMGIIAAVIGVIGYAFLGWRF